MVCCGCNLTKRSTGCVLVTCSAFLVLGLVLVALRGKLLHQILEDNLSIVPGTQMFPNWQDLPVPILTSIYFFNVTNAGPVKDEGAKPVLVEVGPYVYREFHHKTKLQWNDPNGTLTYQQVRTWRFDENLTGPGLSENDFIVTLNPPAATVNAISAKSSGFVRGIINLALMTIGEELFVARRVRELLFEGYTDPILTDTKDFPPSIVPQKMDKFGYFYPRNGSDWFDGVFNMYTGKGDLSKLGQIAAWNFTSKVPFFPDKCGEVRGAGDFFPPGESGNTFVELYSNDLCRPIRLDFVEQKTMDGVQGNVYKVSPALFANRTVNPDNWCYNPENEVPSGVFNASSCRFGAPIFMSQPHFYQADPSFLDQIGGSGMSPSQELHETTFFIEPQSGMPVDVTARFQVNLRIEPIKQIKMFQNLRTMYFPTVWFETKVVLPAELVREIWLLSNLTTIVATFGYLFIGSALVFAAAIVACYFGKTARERADAQQAILNTSLFQETDEGNED